ncbi:hypothetical protein AMET1_1272 [Methanonatronarchaeum thermophilum]|uniref:Amphi-Trp domain-containing protein n=1 Tax=Methanonatronarchaeum thermophilum TaxID=1927129 RepID=A0A1Y3GAB3_9EURY|nr:amphi-Trp domain-containing protein [Methanonatronarchaeum thermophilum]OUJ18359.1 hypothetical protein AMET1_1272 [Methanonatronarchaeum thermophilum]
MKMDKKDEGPKRVIQGRFQEEFYMTRKETAEFLRNLADEIEKSNEIKITTQDWELPFKIREDVEVEIELEENELEIEIEFEKHKDKKLQVE